MLNYTISFANRVVVILVFSIYIFSLIIQYCNTARLIQESMYYNAGTAAEGCAWTIQSYKNSVEALGTVLSYSEKDSDQEKQDLLSEIGSGQGFVQCHYISLSGKSFFDGNEYGDKNYFLAAANGNIYITDPVESKKHEKKYMIISAPVWENASKKRNVKGIVACYIYADKLGVTLENVGGTENTVVYILDKDGKTVLQYNNSDNPAIEVENIFDEHSKKIHRKIANIERIIVSENHGTNFFFDGLSLYYIAYHKIYETSGWSIAVSAPFTDYIGFNVILDIMYFILMLFVASVITRYFDNHFKELFTPLYHIIDKLKNANPKDFNNDIESDRFEETKMITEISKVFINQLYSHLDNGMDLDSDLLHLINKKSIIDLLNVFSSTYQNMISFAIYDKKGTAIVDQLQEGEKLTRPILLGERIVGTITSSCSDKYSMSGSQREKIADSIATVISCIAKANSVQDESLGLIIEQKDAEIKSIIDFCVILKRQLIEWCETPELFGTVTSHEKYISCANPIIAQLDYFITNMIAPEVNCPKEEQEYTFNQLTDKIRQHIEKSLPAEKYILEVESSNFDGKIFLGDMEKIAIAVKYAVMNISLMTDNITYVSVSHEQVDFSDNAIFEVYCNFNFDVNSAFYRAKALLAGDFSNSQYEKPFTEIELRYITIYRLILKLCGTVSIQEQNGRGIVIKLSIPQLNVVSR